MEKKINGLSFLEFATNSKIRGFRFFNKYNVEISKFELFWAKVSIYDIDTKFKKVVREKEKSIN